MSRIAEVARLKELVGRRNAIIEREGDPRTPNYAILERMEIERDMMGAAPWLLAVAGQFQAEDAEIIDRLIREFGCPGEEDGQGMCTKCIKDLDCLRRMLAAAKAMEAEPCQ